jgi:hypothetical protein
MRLCARVRLCAQVRLCMCACVCARARADREYEYATKYIYIHTLYSVVFENPPLEKIIGTGIVSKERAAFAARPRSSSFEIASRPTKRNDESHTTTSAAPLLCTTKK